MVSMAKLRGTWAGIVYARRILHLDRVIIESDFATVIAWIREARRSIPSYPIIHDIALLLQGCTTIIIRHVYKEANFVGDWVTSNIARHSGDILWTQLDDASVPFRDITLFDSLGYVYFRIII